MEGKFSSAFLNLNWTSMKNGRRGFYDGKKVNIGWSWLGALAATGRTKSEEPGGKAHRLYGGVDEAHGSVMANANSAGGGGGYRDSLETDDDEAICREPTIHFKARVDLYAPR